ncbi:sensor histidine kinase [Herbaspirillum seropedicae]|uniref:C4-dicarboxylate transport sensor protein DctB n=1 Tax=Herbaspirillum seropedicae (strain SmR1) TaxID=757424 RepID=D8J256_HERSS|nr:ATP-binding protein [Herbaspirillum seropedicae]ADJ64839.1 C4-dicarboxylate transport sensor kinase transcription regulator protein [Herbaspirillum seropedicae SmR1]AKN66744.1 C4-dicarboxylate ABC transporter [Herbaspirillum seropedicae]NQE28260.1 C4-dicarboxylate ABC transporter [Herbaspirillum seropedicae]UMU22734.1 sensor histidine kinase [Herbaspirillum seropedicae]
MRARRNLLILTLFLVATLLVCGITYRLALRKAEVDQKTQGAAQLQIAALDLESILQKYEALPFALGFQADVRQVLQHPDDVLAVDRLNRAFKTIQQQSQAVSIFMLDRRGLTLASSNWDDEFSFVGRDFGFRPYFSEAVQGRAGRFYGIGNISSEPGYFIAQPIYRRQDQAEGDLPIGVMVVKVDLAEFEHTWRSSADPITLTDAGGVVFLSNRPEWKYHSLQALSPPMQQALAGTHQYADLPITPVSALPPALQSGFGSHVSRPVGRLGWQLMLFPSQARMQRTAMLWTMACALLMLALAISLLAWYQHRRRLEERMASRDALRRAAAELEQRIAERTGQLTAANQALEARYEKLQQTESLLRTTQNELVQAGKLAMLGQMAAGVTHELNQPLTAIRAFADNAVKFLARGQSAQAVENLEYISSASATMGKIIAQLKGFARKSGEAVACVDLSQAIEASSLLLASECQKLGATISIDIRAAACVTGDVVRTEQVLVNLLRNALDAVEEAEHKRIAVVLEVAGGYALVRIRDSGGGIADEVAPHLFEPFFTTKSSSKGLGLGLAISSSIVQAMNGQLSAHNHEEGGAEFVVRLPLLKMET